MSKPTGASNSRPTRAVSEPAPLLTLDYEPDALRWEFPFNPTGGFEIQRRNDDQAQFEPYSWEPGSSRGPEAIDAGQYRIAAVIGDHLSPWSNIIAVGN